MRLPLPRTLRGQIILLILAALAAAQALTLWLFLDQRALAVRSALSLEAADRAGNIARLLEDAPPKLHPEILRAASSALVQFAIGTTPTVSRNDLPAPPWIARRIRALIGTGSLGEIRVAMRQRDFATNLPAMPGAPPAMMRGHHEIGEGRIRATELNLSIALKDGSWLNMTSRLRDPPYQWVSSEVSTFLVTAALLAAVLWFALSRLVGPIQRLSRAADHLGRGEDVEPIAPAGPQEMRQLAAAFNQMQDRLHRFVTERTRLLGALGHDLRSPLTALRVRAEMVDDAETRERMIATIGEMQEMIEATLDFARGMATTEPVETVRLSDLLGPLCAELREAGGAVRLGEVTDVALRIRHNTMRRAIRNLIENALRYGKRATVTGQIEAGAAVIRIEDEGPGIPEASLERVFDPFVRLETSRSRETGGVGLGLSIARTIILAHGGEIALKNRKQGGLAVTVRLPVAEARSE